MNGKVSTLQGRREQVALVAFMNRKVRRIVCYILTLPYMHAVIQRYPICDER